MPCSASKVKSQLMSSSCAIDSMGREAVCSVSGLRRCVFLALVWLSSTVLASNGDLRQPGFRIIEATTYSREGQRFADVRVAFNFSPQAREALENGVAITVFVDTEIRIPGLLWDTTVVSTRTGLRIQIHALSKKYRVMSLYTGQSTTYRSFRDMMNNIGFIKNQPLIDEHKLENDQRYQLWIRASLDIESLPSPLRPLAYLSAPWQLSSDWSTWPFHL